MSRGQVDREDAEVARVLVELDGRVARRAGRLLVRGEQCVLERLDERAALDALLALDRLDAFDDLSWSFRRHLVDQVAAHDGVVGDVNGVGCGCDA